CEPTLLLLAERARADELSLAQLDGPAEPRLERRDVARQLVTVERQRRLEAQRIARAETDRGDRQIVARRVEQRLPELRRALGGDEQLEAVLAGVAGARRDDVDPGDLRLGAAEARERRQRGAAGALRDVDRARSLQRDQP